MSTAKLLSRDDFREGVLARDKHQCVFCNETKNLAAHHIIERRLFTDGGYYLNNGATVCETHHLECEMTILSVEDVRDAAGIKQRVVPDTMYADHVYDKWGNPISDNGRRTRGPLFYDESVQKILAKGGVLDLFDHYTKAARTMHLPWSPGIHDDDHIIQNLDAFIGREVVISEKADGENTSMYRDYFHARSIDGRSHPSRDRVKAMWSERCGDIPDKWRVTGENVYAKHAIHYTDLDDYFYGFGIWDERNTRLDYDDMLMWFKLLNITPVKELWRGIWDEKAIKNIWHDDMRDKMEGYVVTTVKGFPFSDYHKNVAKFVRANHVQVQAKHWQHAAVIPNLLKGKRNGNEEN